MSSAGHALALAGAAPPRYSDLSHAIMALVLRASPLDVRARAACVCRAWRDAAASDTLWHVLRFDDGFSLQLRNATLAALCARAGAALRELHLDAPACEAVTAAGTFAALRAGGCAGVQRLTLPEWDTLNPQALRAFGS
jgi:hypothetical protein